MTYRKYLILLLLPAGFVAGWFSKNPANTKEAQPSLVREGVNKYALIHPLITASIGEKKDFSEYKPLEDKFNETINRYKKQKKLYSAAIYFNNMENGHWTGINENEKFAPASLYKVPLMIAYLKNAESIPGYLDKKVEYIPNPNETKINVEGENSLVAGNYYTLNELIYRLIAFSDNNSKDLLHENIDQNSVSEVFADLGLTAPEINETEDSMSARSYSRFFRTLYSSTYLSREISEAAMELLTKTEYKDGLIQGVPGGTVVAHKFGYRVFPEAKADDVSKELHDCGIIYYPGQPYLLCIMTKGFNLADLQSFIKEVSSTAWAEAGKNKN